MNKKAISTLSYLGELILAAIILFIILSYTFYLIGWYYGREECDNKAVIKDLYDIIQDLENNKIQSADLTNIYNKECYITTFNQDQSYNQINPPTKNNFKSPFICLCNLNNDECVIDNPQSCIELKTFTQINDAQFTTKDLDTYIFLNFKREDKKLVISEATNTIEPKQEPEENQIEPSDINNLLIAMDYAKTNTVEGRKCKCNDKCNDYANWIIKYSQEFSPPDDQLDPLFVLSMVMQESNCEPKSCKWDNSQYSCGLMQVNKNDFTKRGENPLDPETQIKAGIRHLKKKYDSIEYYERINPRVNSCYDHKNKWEKAIHAYNGWLCSNLYYIKDIKSRYETLKNPREPLLTAQK